MKRLSCPLAARRFWIAINAIVRHRKSVNLLRVTRYLVRNYNMTERDIDLQLRYCLHDKLVIAKIKRHYYRGSNKKGRNKKGSVEKRFCIPEEQMTGRRRRDWYCFECHRGGRKDVVKCCSCHRVFHFTCVNYGFSSNFKCYVCGSSKTRKTDPRKLNYLLKFVLNSLKALCSEDVWEKTYLQHLPISLLIFKTMNLSTIQKKISQMEYSHIEQFKGDIQNIVHNTFIYLGENSDTANQAKQMFEFCVILVKDIQMCSECYLASVDKPKKDWFCKPCQPPHKLVYAQVRGYPYWPAKLMQVIDNNFHVRFFGGFHQRGVVGRNHIKPITVNIDDIQKVPKSSSWEKACNELKKHLVLLKNNPACSETKLPFSIDSNELLKREENQSKRKFDGTKAYQGGFSCKRQKMNPLYNERFSSVSGENGYCVNSQLKSAERATKCQIKQLRSSGTQTICANHKHQKHICGIGKSNQENVSSLSVQNKYLEEIEANSGRKMEDFLKMFNPEKVKFHNYQNPKCPLNNYKNYCVPNCNVENEKKQRIKSVLCSLNRTFDNCVIKLAHKHKKNIDYIKKRRWCVQCSREADIHCCWNTEYCSENCQNEHWLKGHWKVCQSRDS